MQERSICHTRFNIIINPHCWLASNSIYCLLHFSCVFSVFHTLSLADGKNNHIISAEWLLLTHVGLHYSYHLESGNYHDNVLWKIKWDSALCGQAIINARPYNYDLEKASPWNVNWIRNLDRTLNGLRWMWDDFDLCLLLRRAHADF